MPLMSGGDAVVRSILGHGISTIYCLPGVQSDHLFNAMFDVGDALTVVHTRHEQGAAYMALGAALATGKPAAYSVVPGPGLPQLDRRARHRVFDRRAGARAGRPDPEPRHRQGPRLPARDSRPDRHPAQADQIGGARGQAAGRARDLGRAFQQLRSGRPRPVGLEVPPDMLQTRAEVELSAPLALDPEPALDEEAIARAADLLAKAECPVIFVGGGALDAAAEVRALAERLTAPVVSYRRGRGVLDDRHPTQPFAAGRACALEDGRRRARGRHAAAIAAQSPGAPTTTSS